MKTHEEKRRAVEKAFIFFDEIIMNRMLVGIGMVKAILMKSWTEIRNMLLSSREKAIFSNVAKNWTKSCSHSSALWKIEVASAEIGYLTEEISQQSVGSS